MVVRGERIHTMEGKLIERGVIVIRGGKIRQIGTADSITIPADLPVLEAKVVTPGLIDAHSVVGLAGILNQDEDQDQLEGSSPIQPQLRAIDAYNPFDPLIEWIREFGVTTVHTGHAPGALISGQTMIVKTVGNSVEEAVINPAFGVVCTLGESGLASGGKSPGTRGKMMAMLRQKLIDAKHYQAELDAQQTSAEKPEDDSPAAGGSASGPARNLELEALAQCLRGELKLIIHANRSVDIRNALRLAEEFQLQIMLDSAAEGYMLTDALLAAEVPVLVHPTMARATGDQENLTFRNAALLADAGVPVALQSGYEAYVPKVRVVLFEAGVAASHGFGFERALASITIDAAKMLGIDDRVGSLAVGKDADLALYDGDPFEYTTHCVGVVIDGVVVSQQNR